MPNLTRRWHKSSIFGPGPRRALDRGQRAIWKARIELYRRAGQLTDGAAHVALALVKRLGTDGRCDPSHTTLAEDASESISTVKRALDALQELGLVWWVRRLIREGWRTEQTSNAYALAIGPTPELAPSTDAQSDRATQKLRFSNRYKPEIQASTIPEGDRIEARMALAAIAARRQAAVLAGLTAKRLTRGAVALA